MSYAEVRTKDGFVYNFVENIIINKKSYDRSCISSYLVTRDVFKVLKLHSPAVRAILRTLKISLVNRIDVSQECPPGSASFRDAQCSLFNRRDIFINGQKARWISYMRGNKTM